MTDRPQDLPRQGPRPLPLHLTIAMLVWSSSRLAWPVLRNASPSWAAQLDPRFESLRRALDGRGPDPRLDQALEREIASRAGRLLEGIQRYRHHPYRRRLTDPPLLWREGTTRLLDFGPPDGRPLLVVPSLINRSTVLDLMEGKSLLRWLAGQGLRPLLVDWDAPGALERGFTLTDYICGRLEAALDVALAATGRPPLVLGYCMGGLLALGLALRRQADVAGLALLAAPWDFHAEGQAAEAKRLAQSLVAMAPALEALGELPVDVIQSLFLALDPLLGVKKFTAFARLDPASPKAEAFVALEDWLNEGVPLAAPVAREALGGWYGQNTTAKRAWRLAGRVVEPAAFRKPALVLAPESDRIVPPASARALAEALPGASLRVPPVGHIGMVVSAAAPAQVWQPLADWLREVA